MRFVLVSTACVFLSGIFLSFRWIHFYDSPLATQHPQVNSYLSPEAYPVYGIQAQFDRKEGGGKPISAVYCIPSQYGTSLQSLEGIVVLLHACTHNAFKFFAPSSSCPDCIGLSEEMRLARIVLERGYAAVAVTAGSEGGCWGGDKDIKAIQTALEGFRGHWETQNKPQHLEIKPTVYALGASSGGSIAAKLVADGVAESAAVMVMSLRNPLLDKILALPGINKLYLAPMTRDKGTAKRVRENEVYWKSKQQPGDNQHELIVDEISCLPLAVTTDYLWNRVPGMTQEAAQTIVKVLLEHKHLDPNTMKLIVDPTRSKWRDFFLKDKTLQMPNTLQLSQRESKQKIPKDDPNNSMMLWGTFDLTPGISPLAKALHRAWAMHEYCSEIVNLSLDYFEGKKSRDQVLNILQTKKQDQGKNT